MWQKNSSVPNPSNATPTTTQKLKVTHPHGVPNQDLCSFSEHKLRYFWQNPRVLWPSIDSKGSLSLRSHTHRRLNMAHLSGDTSGVSKSSSDRLDYTWFLGDVCVAFFNVPPGNKNTVVSNPFTKSCRVYNCDNERLSGSTKRWIFKSIWKI